MCHQKLGLLALRRSDFLAKGISTFMSRSQYPDVSLFATLPEKRPPWWQFLVSMSTQSVAVAVLAWVAVLHPEVLAPPVHDYHFVELVPTPVPVNHEPAPVRVIKPTVVEPIVPRAEAIHVPPPQIRRQPPAEDAPVAPKIELAAKAMPVTPAVPRRLVATNVFSTGSSAIPTIAAAPQKTQTGGFGDPNGVPAKPTNGKPVNIAQLGSFDLPSGPGYGNGTAGAQGAKGVVASAGFGNGTAVGDGSSRTANTTRGTVRESGFGDAEPAAAAARPKPEAARKMVPAEILAKPNPIYTDEARKLHIEGEVLLEVVFESSGRLRVVRVVRGLGHGLDEAAIRAAEQIRFKPALQDGQSADSTAVLHIIFQLA
jgi:TonB family protein